MHRPQSILSTGVNGQSLWTSGQFAFDGVGNISAIGEQKFAYDAVGRLMEAHITQQAGLAHVEIAQRPMHEISYSFDLYGNMSSRTVSASTPAPPAALIFAATHEKSEGGVALNKNQIEDTSHSYDSGGNLLRFTGKDGAGHQVGAGWDERNRLRVFFEGDPHAGGSPGESYLYDASSYRLVILDKTGVPRFSLRTGAGQTLSEYLLPRGSVDCMPVLDRDFVYGAGQLLVERQVVADVMQLHSAALMKSGDDYLFSVGDADLEASYALDISSSSGFRNHLTGIDLDASGNFLLPESELSPDETNFLKIRMENGAGTPYSRGVKIAYDSSVTSASDNQIRSMSVSRSGTDLVLRWNLLEENDKPTVITFTRADTGVSYVVSPGPLAPGTTLLTLDSQALGTPCGSFGSSQRESDGTMSDSAVHLQLDPLGPGGLCEPDPGDPPPGDDALVFNETFHHRDHLGSLRVATDEAGWSVQYGRLDYYPFGMRMDSSLPPSTRRHYTGHEHDPDTGLEYMLARFGSTGKGRFLTVDPARDVSEAVPVSWNRYAYVRGNPLSFADYTGRDMDLPTAFSRVKGAGLARGSWSDYSPERIAGDVAMIYDRSTPLVDLQNRLGRTMQGNDTSIGLETSASVTQDQALMLNMTVATFASDLMKQGVARDTAIDLGLVRAVQNFDKIEAAVPQKAPNVRGNVLATAVVSIGDPARKAAAIAWVNKNNSVYSASASKDGSVTIRDRKTGETWYIASSTPEPARAVNPVGTVASKDPTGK